MSYTYSRRYYDANSIAGPSGVAPTAPHSLRVTAVADTSIDLAWFNSSTNEDNIEIERRDSSGSWSALVTLGSGVQTYSNTGLSANTAYAYRVRATNGTGNSDWSDIIIDATSDAAAVLADDHWWQRVLRAWIADFVSTDFDVTLSTITNVTGTMTDEEVWNAYCVNENRGFNSPQTKGFRMSSSFFTLSDIENGGNINLRSGRTGDNIEPQATAFYAYWDNPLNIHYDDENIYRRALVAVAVDEIETVAYMEADLTSRVRSDFTGGYLCKWAMPYWMYQNHPGSALTSVDVNTHEAFLAAMRYVWDLTVDKYPSGSGGADLEAFQLKAAPYLYALGVINLDEYKDRVAYVIEEITNPIGGAGFYHDHGGDTEIGIDMAYEGIMYSYMTEAAIAEHFLVPNTHIIRSSVERMMDMISHIVCVDHSGLDDTIAPTDATRIHGPTSFNTGTAGQPLSQWQHPMRDWEASYLMDSARWRIHGHHNEVYFINQKAVRSRSDMINSWGLVEWLTKMNAAAGAGGNNYVDVDAATPNVWAADHWLNRLPSLVLHGVTGFYADVIADDVADSDETLLHPPVMRSANFTKDYVHLGGSKLGNLHTTVHKGPIRSTWSSNPSQLRGGLTSFYIKDKGIFVLGTGTGGQDASADDWATHDTWSVNTISGTVTGGQFSEARHLGAGLSIDSVDAIGGIIKVSDANDMTQLYKKGDMITYEDWQNGTWEVFTLTDNATHENGVTTIPVNENVNASNRGVVYPVGCVLTDDTFLYEIRSLVDSVKDTYSVNSATIDGLVVKRIVSGTEDRTQVTVSFTSEGQEAITGMWEQIPMWQGYQHANYGMTAAYDYWDGSAWQTLGTTYVDTEKIRMTRDLNIGNGDVFCYIDLKGNQKVRLNSAVNTPGATNDKEVTLRNIQIQVSDTNIKGRHELTYYLQETDPV